MAWSHAHAYSWCDLQGLLPQNDTVHACACCCSVGRHAVRLGVLLVAVPAVLSACPGHDPDAYLRRDWQDGRASTTLGSCPAPQEVPLSGGHLTWGPVDSGAFGFGSVRDVALVGSDLLVADPMTRVVHVVPLEDRGPPAVLGREGAGPWEFRNPAALATGGSQRIAVLDVANRRVATYGLRQATWEALVERPARGVVGLAYDRAGRLVLAYEFPKLPSSEAGPRLSWGENEISLADEWRGARLLQNADASNQWRPLVEVLGNGWVVLTDRHEPLLLAYEASGAIRLLYQPCPAWALPVVGRARTRGILRGILTGAVSTSDSVVWWSIYPRRPDSSPLLIEVPVDPGSAIRAFRLTAPPGAVRTEHWEVLRRVGRCRWVVWRIRDPLVGVLELCVSSLDSLST